jgi:phosphohistidine swiveling domain-containing protein
MSQTKALLPAKYENLLILKAIGLRTPPSWLIGLAENDPDTLKAKIEAFTQKHPGSYIVRSAISAEDGSQHSLAGHFYSSEAVSQKTLLATISDAIETNKALVAQLSLQATVFLMVQPFYEAIKGGVAFTRWQYFNHCYVVTMADTPQEAVNGVNTKTLLVNKDKKIYFGTGNEQEKNILNSLVEALVIIEKNYGAMDVEWAYTKEDGLVILQMRPITIPAGFLTSASKAQTEKSEANLKKVSTGPWQQNELSANLGPLSPLSFSLMKFLYKGSAPALQAIGLASDNLGWLQRMDNGQIFCDTTAYAKFFGYKYWWSPMILAFQKPFKEQLLQDYLKTYQPPKIFKISHVQEIFNYWMLANIYLASEKGSVVPSSAQFGDYELARPSNGFYTDLYVTNAHNWAHLSFNLKIRFFEHLELLKKDLLKPPMAYWLTWEEYVKKVEPTDSALRRSFALKNSYYSLPVGFGEHVVTNRTYLTDNHQLEGFIWHPKTTPAPPQNAIYCDEIFDNRLVSLIPNLKGIIVGSGSHLAHSAIVAREHNIPYIIDDIDLYPAGTYVSISNTHS